MTQNKTLAAAVTLALSIGSGAIQAGSLALTEPTSPNVALELFDPAVTTVDTQLPSGTATFKVTYQVSESANVGSEVNIKYTLNNAEFAVLPDATQVDAFDNGSAETAGIPISAGLTRTTTEVTYVLNATNFDELQSTGTITFSGFQIKVAETNLSTKNSKVTLDIELSGGITDTRSVTLVEAVPAKTVTFSSANTDNPLIDVASGGTDFVEGTTTGVTTVYLGSIVIGDATGVNGLDMASSASVSADSTSLTLSNGPFGSLTDIGTTQTVYIDTATTCDGSSTAATTVVGDQAIWTTGVSTETTNYICLDVGDTNADELVETELAPQAILTADYSANTLIYEGNLYHLKRNGAVCKVYNVTDDQRTDTSNVRITNLSTREANLVLSLRDMNNNIIIHKAAVGPVAPKQTFVLNSTKLVELAAANPDPNGTVNTAWGRGVLTVTGDVSEGNLDVALLLRAGSGGPLMNMSTGATGSGCGK